MEVAATLGVGACLIAVLVLTRGMRGTSSGWGEAALAVTMGSGLVLGYAGRSRVS